MPLRPPFFFPRLLFGQGCPFHYYQAGNIVIEQTTQSFAYRQQFIRFCVRFDIGVRVALGYQIPVRVSTACNGNG